MSFKNIVIINYKNIKNINFSMSSQYNTVLYTPNDFPEMNYLNPFGQAAYQYSKYIPRSPINNQPVYYEPKNISDIVDCEISMEDNSYGSNSSSNRCAYYNSSTRSPKSRKSNNPINNKYKKIRARSPQTNRKSNFQLDDSGNYYINNIYRQSHSPITRSNSLSNYSIGSYSPIKSNVPLVNNISNFKPVEYEYNINNNLGEKPINILQEQIYNTPMKNNYSVIPNTLSASTVYNKSQNPKRNLDENLKRNITYFQVPQNIYNYAPINNYPYLIGNPAVYNINNNNNKLDFNNNPQMNPKVYKSILQNNNINKNINSNNDKNMNNKNINSPTKNNPNFINANLNSLSPIKDDNSNTKFLNSNSSSNRSVNNLFQSCSNTALLSNSVAQSFQSTNLNRSSSLKKLNVSDFNESKILAGKNPSLASEEKNNQEINNNRINMTNNINNSFINKNISSNNTFIQKNNSFLSTQQNSLIKNKSNLIKKNNNIEEKPSDDFSQYIYDQINKIRTNPRSFLDTFKKAKKRIKQDKKGNLYYSGKIKVALYKGEEAFDEAISSLEKTIPMKPLIFKKDLCIKISNDKNDFMSGDYLRKKISELIKSGGKIRAFWRDIIKDPEINFLLMIVDDNPIRRGAKRKDVLNPEMKYIGINSGIIDKYFVCYTVLSDE